MGSKRYVVREGFNFRVRDEKGNEKIFSEGDILSLEQEDGDAAHQLEYADDKDRTAALKAEAEARKAVAGVQPQPSGIDQDALAAAIANGITDAFAKMQAAAPKV